MYRYGRRYTSGLAVLVMLGLLWPLSLVLATDAHTLTYANGDVYVGEVVDGKRQGQGTYTYQDGKRYTGAWQDEKRHGQGTLTFPSGDKYAGEWRDEKPSGRGTWLLPDGTQYSGEWKAAPMAQSGGK